MLLWLNGLIDFWLKWKMSFIYTHLPRFWWKYLSTNLLLQSLQVPSLKTDLIMVCAKRTCDITNFWFNGLQACTGSRSTHCSLKFVNKRNALYIFFTAVHIWKAVWEWNAERPSAALAPHGCSRLAVSNGWLWMQCWQIVLYGFMNASISPLAWLCAQIRLLLYIGYL